MSTNSHPSCLMPGDHVVYKMNPFMTHHGIFIGNKSFIHYDGKLVKDEKRRNTVCQVTASDFLDKNFERRLSVRRYKLSHEKLSSPEETIARAKSRLGEKAYHLLESNCEHFCSWARISHSYSVQVADKHKLGYDLVEKVHVMGNIAEAVGRAGVLVASVGVAAAALYSAFSGRRNFTSNYAYSSYQAKRYIDSNKPKVIKEVITRKRELTLDEINFMMEYAIMRDSFEDVYIGVAKNLLT